MRPGEDRRKSNVGPPGGFERRGTLEYGKHGSHTLARPLLDNHQRAQMALFEDKLRAYGRELGTAHDKVGKGLMSTAQLNSLNEAHIQELLTLHRKIILGENRGESHKK